MHQTLNQWVRVGNCFVKKQENGKYEVFHIKSRDEVMFVDEYEWIDLKSVKESDFNMFGIYEDFITLQTDVEKVAYIALHERDATVSYYYEDIKDVSQWLIECNIIAPNETFQLI